VGNTKTVARTGNGSGFKMITRGGMVLRWGLYLGGVGTGGLG